MRSSSPLAVCRCTTSCTRTARVSGFAYPKRRIHGCLGCTVLPTPQAFHPVRQGFAHWACHTAIGSHRRNINCCMSDHIRLNDLGGVANAGLLIWRFLLSSSCPATWQLLECSAQEMQHAALCPAGVAVPSDQQAIGWRVAVYWPDDSTLHDGEIVGYDNVSLRHHVRYDCGDQEHVALNATKVSCARHWYCNPKIDGPASKTMVQPKLATV